MTDEDIRKLATQYADELFKDDDMSDSGNIDERHDVWEVCNSFGNFLLERFCIVEKSVMDKLSIVYRAKVYNLVCLNKEDAEALFGKELFNDTEI